MTANDYRKVLLGLGLTIIGAAPVLGIHPRTSQRYANGQTKIPKMVEQIIEMKLKERK